MTEPRDALGVREAEIVAEYWLDAQQTNAHDALLNLAHAFALVEQQRAASPTPDAALAERNRARSRGEDASGGYREVPGCKCECCLATRGQQ